MSAKLANLLVAIGAPYDRPAWQAIAFGLRVANISIVHGLRQETIRNIVTYRSKRSPHTLIEVVDDLAYELNSVPIYKHAPATIFVRFVLCFTRMRTAIANFVLKIESVMRP